jgi:hypothetical protein
VATFTGVSTAGAAPTPQVVSKALGTAATAQSDAAYWTPARMRAAKPYPMPAVSKLARLTTKQLTATGKPAAITGYSSTGQISSGQVPTATSVTAPAPAAFGYPAPYTRFPVYPASLMNSFPWKVNGKVFFIQNGGSYVCSGTAVVAPSGLRVWTAGHCTSDGAGHWDTKASFVPSYNNGSAPFGVWNVTNVYTSSDWFNSGDFSRDLGSMKVHVNSSGQKLSAVVGVAGFAWNQAYDQEWTDISYPAASPFNGLIPWEIHSATATTVNVGSGPAATGIGSDFTGGSSGGSWRILAGGSGVGYINGHNDFKFSSQPLSMYSPYFDSLANTVRCTGEATGSYGC